MENNLNIKNPIPTFEQMMALFVETRNLIDKNAKEAEKRHLEFEMRNQQKLIEDEKIRIEESKRSKELDKKIKDLGKEIGKVHRERGTYTEIILMPSIEDIILNKFKYDFFDTNYKRRRNDDEIQIDAIGFSNGKRNELMIVEVKTQLKDDDIEQLQKHLERFDYFYPEHKEKQKFGLLAALSTSKEMIEKVHKRGFYFAKIKNDMLILNNSKDFIPKAF